MVKYNSMRTGIATVPLDDGRCPLWLFRRMKQLSRGIVLAICQEFGPEEVLKRLADPVWFQSLGCVSGFDYNSSGLTTTTLGALKEGLRGLERELGIFICGGKGKTSRKTPQQIQDWGEFLGLPTGNIDKLVYASRVSAKVDSSALQDGFQIYHHNLIFTKQGHWAIIQQGMNINFLKARRYHWFSSNLKERLGREDFIEEPHTGIASDMKVRPLNLTAKESDKNRDISLSMAKDESQGFLKNLNLLQTKKSKNLTLLQMQDVEFHWHPVVEEKFDLKRLQKTIFAVKEREPRDFEQLVALEGVGPRTIRALSLVAEIIYGAKPSYEDPARYTFAVGGKDGTPYFVEKDTYDSILEVMEKGIKKSQISQREKQEALGRLTKIS